MKKLMMLSAVAALMLGGSAYAADVNDPTVQIKASASAYKLAPAEFNAYAAGYSLSNGNFIKFTQTGNRYWATLKDGDRVEMYAVQSGVFMTAAGARIEFQEEGDALAIDNYERLPAALAMNAVNVRVIAAR